MESYPASTRRRFQDQVFVWDRKFESRQRHDHESHRLTPENQDSIITTFMKQPGSQLDPPQYNYTALCDFLEMANEDDLKAVPAPAQDDEFDILLDDRRDDTGWEVGGTRHWARDWNSYAGGYPPEGQSVVSSKMTAKDLYRKQQRSVSSPPFLSRRGIVINPQQKLEDGAERRIL